MAIDAYVADGWWFVASRLTPPAEALSSDDAPLAPHPLGLRFAAPKAVYPMRLTGAQNSRLRVDLFTFADRMARAPGFETRRCAEAELLPPRQMSDGWRSPGVSRPRPSEHVLVGHEQLRGLVNQLPTATRLSATLTPAQMRDDVWLDWVERLPTGNSVITSGRAIGRATTTWSVLLVVGSLVMLATWRRTTPARVVTRIALIAMVLLPAGAGFAVWISNPGVGSGVSSNRYDYRLDELHWQLESLFQDRIEADPAWAADLDPDSAEQVCRELLSSAWREAFDQPSGEWRNELLGTAMREVREPGACRIWQEDGSVWFATCDIAGQETATRLWTRGGGKPGRD